MKYKDKYYKMRYIKAIYIGLIGILLAGCQADQWESIEGGFQITLSDEVTVTTKSTPEELGEPTTDKFKLKIVNEATNNAAYDGAYKSGTIPAAAGTYTVTATFGDNPVLALDDPYYKGEKTGVLVKDGETTSVNISCTVANALASVVFPDATEMAKIYQSYWVKVAVEDYSTKLEPNSTKSAYFQAGKEVAFYFEGTKLNGQSVSAKLIHDNLPTTFEAADHYKLTLTFNDDLSLDISKVEAETVTISETIPMEWLPKPKVEAEGFEGNELSFVETENKTASIKLVTATALQDLKLKFNFEDEQFISSLPKEEYVLSNTGDKQAVETALGITLPEIGTTDANLDLSPLLAKLQTNAGVPTNNSIEIDAKANNRWSSEDQEANRTYTLVCNKPEFTVSAYPGNIWTKEFTMNALMENQVTKGNFSKLSKDMNYQFSINGESDWEDLGKDLRKDGLTPGKTYYIRGVYRGEICSDPVAVSTYPIIELENGGLENYQIVKGEDKTGSRYGAHYEWNSWCTLNDLTCDDTHAFIWGNTAFNSRSGTRPTTDARTGGDGKAVWISTIGWGYGTTTYHTITPGELFLGTLSNVNHDDDTYTKSYGITYSSRPTALHFWYKYAPFDGDHSDIYIQVLGENQEVLGEATLNNSETVSVYTETTLNITYYEDFLSVPVTSLNVVFKTGNKLSVEARGETGVRGEGDPAYRGSELYIDDISLVYDK